MSNDDGYICDRDPGDEWDNHFCIDGNMWGVESKNMESKHDYVDVASLASTINQQITTQLITRVFDHYCQSTEAVVSEWSPWYRPKDTLVQHVTISAPVHSITITGSFVFEESEQQKAAKAYDYAMKIVQP